MMACGGLFAQQTNYWSFNDDNKIPDVGAATLTTSYTGIGVGVEVFSAGSALNALSGFPAGDALTYIDYVNVFSDHTMIISGLDFTGQQDVNLSFAWMSDQIFQIGEIALIDYDIGGGWIGAQVIPLPTAAFTIQSFSFGGALDNQGSVSIRLQNLSVFEVGTTLIYDNVLITSAIPESSPVALLLGSLVILGGAIFLRRYRQTSATAR